MEIGSKVKFIDASDAQVNWGSNDDPRKMLDKNKVYIVEDIEEHAWHTKIYLEGVKGKFNPVSFEEV